MLLCVSTNGLALPRYLDEVMAIGVSHVTVTVNAVDPEIGRKIYAWVRDGKIIHRNLSGAQVLLERQLESIRGLVDRGIVVKVNTIVIPGVNDHQVPEVARTMAELGVDVLNCMAMVPNAGTPFADVPEPSHGLMAEIRGQAEAHLPQMKHCQRCRADAVGLLEEDRSAEFASCLEECAGSLELTTEGRPYVAVASLEGVLVNQHLGEAATFQVWGPDAAGLGFRLVEEREAPPKGGGVDRWRTLAGVLSDCRAVLVSGVGEGPRAILTEEGVLPVEMSGFVDLGLQAAYAGTDVGALKRRRVGAGCSKGIGCKGDGAGCG
jgi:nitrogen fixation protein NifB